MNRLTNESMINQTFTLSPTVTQDPSNTCQPNIYTVNKPVTQATNGTQTCTLSPPVIQAASVRQTITLSPPVGCQPPVIQVNERINK